VLVEEDDISVWDELQMVSEWSDFVETGAYRFDTLSAFSPYIEAEDAVAPPLPFPCESIETRDVTQSRLHRSSLEV
jgi:hypothetical protein